MQITLNAVDVFNAAIMLEERSARFYVAAAVGALGDAQKLLLLLAEMETDHAVYFRNILADLQASATTQETEESEDPDETKAFLQALTSDRVITSDCRLELGDTIPQILEKAMYIEKNSVFFYTSVKSILQAGISASEVDRLISEEVGHFKMLSDALVGWRVRNKIS